jgi:nitrogenase-associated protein
LKQSGHKLDERNLLTEAWTAAKLLAYFNDLPVTAWFNQSDPSVKSGELKPDMLTAEQAIQCMLQNPLLIRRPLIEIKGQKIVGFNENDISKYLKNDATIENNLEACPRLEQS